MKVTTKHEIVTIKNHDNHAQLVVSMFINKLPAGSIVVMSGPKDAIEDFVAGKIDQAGVMERFGMATKERKEDCLIPNHKEVERACNGKTVVVRPNRSLGGWSGALVDVTTGKPVFKIRRAVTRHELMVQIRDDLRMYDKMGTNNPMASASRTRRKKS